MRGGEGHPFMKYTYEFKRQIVEDYLADRGGVLFLAKKYGVSAKSLVHQWIAAYQKFGDAGLKTSWTKEVYTEKFKREAVERYLSTGDSYEVLAAKLHVKNPATLNRWVREYRAQGWGAWKPKRRGRPPKGRSKERSAERIRAGDPAAHGLILYGAGLIAAESVHYLERQGRGGDIRCFATTSAPQAEMFCGRPIFAAEEAFRRYPAADVLVTLQEKYHEEVAAYLRAHRRKAIGWWGLQHATALLRGEGIRELRKLPGILADADPEDASMMRIARAEAPSESFRLYPMTQIPLKEAEQQALPQIMAEEFPADFGAYPPPAVAEEGDAAEMPSLFLAMACSPKDAAAPSKTLPSCIHPVLGGAALASERPPNMLYDDMGRNISRDNGLYSELSVTYWLHENAPAADYLGICHYRRWLVLTDGLRAALAERSVDVILPRPRITLPDVRSYFLQPTMGTLEERDYHQMLAFLDDENPIAAACARRIFHHRIHIPANILVARADVFHDYAEFLFHVLQAVQQRNEENGIVQEPRSLGYLGELLTTLYVALYHEELRIQYADCHLELNEENEGRRYEK